jgi:hypothetical protein
LIEPWPVEKEVPSESRTVRITERTGRSFSVRPESITKGLAATSWNEFPSTDEGIEIRVGSLDARR